MLSNRLCYLLCNMIANVLNVMSHYVKLCNIFGNISYQKIALTLIGTNSQFPMEYHFDNHLTNIIGSEPQCETNHYEIEALTRSKFVLP